jgi:hypothetical protein
MSYTELRRLPTTYRKWYLERLTRHFEESNSSKSTKDEPISENIQKIDEFIGKLKS